MKRKNVDIICVEITCDLLAGSIGLCGVHYAQSLAARIHERKRREAELLRQKKAVGRPKKAPVDCSVEGCTRRARIRLMCSLHYQRWRKANAN